MKTRYRLIRRGVRGGGFYLHDTQTGKRSSLGTSSSDEAERILSAKNEAERQPALNLQIARAYLAGTDSGITTRTWTIALDALIATKKGPTQRRWQRAVKDHAFDLIRDSVLVETKGETLLRVLQRGTVSTNVYLRRIHNYCIGMAWLPWPLLPKLLWPSVCYKEKRAITLREHTRIIERERNLERRAFYQLAWHLGASQSDLANLGAEDVDRNTRVIRFFRQKTKHRQVEPPHICYGAEVEAILDTLPKSGPLFPYLKTVAEKDRATEFRQRCRGLGIEDYDLHLVTVAEPSEIASKGIGVVIIARDAGGRLYFRAFDKKRNRVADKAEADVPNETKRIDDLKKVLAELWDKGDLPMKEQRKVTEAVATIVGQTRIEGVTLHSYRYAWAERAKTCGYPERFAQMALGHNSKAVHRAYAKKAEVQIPSLEAYERLRSENKVIPLAAQREVFLLAAHAGS